MLLLVLKGTFISASKLIPDFRVLYKKITYNVQTEVPQLKTMAMLCIPLQTSLLNVQWN